MMLKICAIIVLFLASVLFIRFRKKKDPAFLFSAVEDVPKGKTFRIRLLSLKNFFYGACIFFVLCGIFKEESTFLQRIFFPHLYFFAPSPQELKTIPRKGIAVYFLIDQSSSMNEDVTVYNPKDVHIEEIPKIALAKRVTKEFVLGDPILNLRGRKDDLVGLIAFARVARIISPLTLDREEFLQRLNSIEPVTNEDEDGTAIGYAIFKAVNLIRATKYYAQRFENLQKPAYNIENQIIIILTDGLQSPNPLDRNDPFRFMRVGQALRYAEVNKVRVYYIGVDPILQQASNSTEMLELKKNIEATGGAFFLANKAESVEAIYNRIDALEKGEIQAPVREKKQSSITNLVLLSWQEELAIISTFSLALFILFETIFVKRVP